MYHTFRSFLFVYGRSNIYTTNTAEKRRSSLFIRHQSITIVTHWNHLINYFFMNIYCYIYVFFPSLIITFYDESQQIMYHLVKKFQVFSTRNSICHVFGPSWGVLNWIHLERRNQLWVANFSWTPNPMYF